MEIHKNWMRSISERRDARPSEMSDPSRYARKYMKAHSQIPWVSGPGEILRHGLSLLKRDSDTNRRLAMISIDNAVELMIKTYLGLPKRISGLKVPRKEYREMSESFPALLDGLEKYAPDKLDGIDLGTIEWYHRLRNELYHQGNGLTVERDKVEIYAEISNLLFKNLFGEGLVAHATPDTELLGEFMAAWVSLEAGLRAWAARNSLTGQIRGGLIQAMTFLKDASILDNKATAELNHLRQIRNEVVHGAGDHRDLLTPVVVDRVKHYADIFDEKEA